MKFTVKHIAKSGRLGCLSGMEKHPGKEFETPLLLMHTRGGNVPHITHEVLQMITTEPLVMQMPLTTILTAFKGIEEFGRGISEFVGLKEYPCYITPQDPSIQTPPGYNKSTHVAVWTRNGKRPVDATLYMAMIENMKPDMYVSLCDGDTNSESSSKRVLKSKTHTSKFFKECYQYHQASKVLNSAALLAPIEGGYDLNVRRACAEEMAAYDVNGFVIDGLHTNGSEAEEITYKAVEAVVLECLAHLPKDKPRVVHGAWNPVTLLQLVAAGFDVFDSSLPFLSTERGSALIFPYNENMEASSTSSRSTNNINLQSDPNHASYEINLEDKVFFEDFEPLLKGCTCLACRKHTKAYIHHLLTSQELLGKVLLMIHNIHHYMEFFASIRRAIQNDSLDALCSIVKSHCQMT